MRFSPLSVAFQVGIFHTTVQFLPSDEGRCFFLLYLWHYQMVLVLKFQTV